MMKMVRILVLICPKHNFAVKILEPQGTKVFWRDILGDVCRDIPGVPQKFEKLILCSNLVP